MLRLSALAGPKVMGDDIRSHAESHDPPAAAANGSELQAASKPLRPVPPQFLGAAVLLIEDEVLISTMMESILQEIGFSSITTAVSVEAAFKAAEAQKFGLIVSDIMLNHPQLNGIDVVASLTRKNPMPAIFVTAHAGPAEIKRIATETPQTAVLRKPLVQRELHNAIATMAGMASVLNKARGEVSGTQSAAQARIANVQPLPSG